MPIKRDEHLYSLELIIIQAEYLISELINIVYNSMLFISLSIQSMMEIIIQELEV